MSRNGIHNFGRIKLTSSIKPEHLTPANIKLVLTDLLPLHVKNAQDYEKLFAIYKGDHEIYDKKKRFRSDINNKFVENYLQHAVNFKVGYVFDGLQYVQASQDNNVSNEENTKNVDVTQLNKFLKNGNKQVVTNKANKTAYIGGVAPVKVYFNTKDQNKPFEIVAIKPSDAFVVYSSDFKGERLFSVELYVVKDYVGGKDLLHINVKTKTRVYIFTLPNEDYKNATGTEINLDQLTYLQPKKGKEETEVNVLKEIPIFEYTLNDERLSLIEIGLDAQNALNKITSANIDDLEQFVQSLIVGINVDIPEGLFEQAREQGVLLLESLEGSKGDLKADIKILSQALDYEGVTNIYLRIKTALLELLGVPLQNIGGGGGDTGQARQTDNGWLMAGMKVKEEETGFVSSDTPVLEFIINKLVDRKLITDLTATDIEIKFMRNKLDNIQSKVQALQMLKGLVSPKDALEATDLFGDVDAVIKNAQDFYGDDYWKEIKKETEINPTPKEIDIKE